MILFPDTHFFLHFRDASELPWGELTSDSEVQLVICRSVQREIDRKERELRGRAQKRARKFSGLVGEIAVTRAPIILKKNGPEITLDYFHRRPAGWSPPADLGEDWDDDMIIADVLAFTKATGKTATLLTNDSGVFRTAEEHDVTSVLLRGKDHWLLPEETDQRDKELTRLRTENLELRNLSPKINLVFEVNGAQCEYIPIKITALMH
jgi:hypothetical protein